ncbi:MAG: cell division protein ZapA [Candidatus Hydrogenedentota bacterium]
MKQTVHVMGQNVTVNTASTDPVYAHDVAQHVNQVSARIAAQLPKISREMLAIMTAMEISDELFRQTSSALPEGRRPKARIETLLKRINDAIGN